MKFKSIATAVATLLLPMAVWAVPVAVSILPAVQSVAQGGVVTVTVRIDGLAGVPDQLSAYDLRVTYDPAVLTFSVGSQIFLADARFGGGALENFDGSTAGVIIDQVDSFLTTPADLALAQAGFDGFNLFSVNFLAANLDTVTNLSFALVPNISPYVLGNNDGNSLAATYTGACVAIGTGSCVDTPPVPEPGTFALMAMGLVAAGAVGRRARGRSKEGTVAA
jgi:hypothetical protein